jgi:long-chain acyl-CoA synthetase
MSTSAPRRRPAAKHDASRPATLGGMILAATERPDGVAARWTSGGVTRQWTIPDLGRRVRSLSAGLIAMGIAPGDRVAILASTRPEWSLVDHAIICAGAVVVPIYQTNSPEECRYVLLHSGTRAVFCEDEPQEAKIAAVRDRLPDLEHVLRFDEIDALQERSHDADPGAVERRVEQVAPDAPATIVYTSGTTGPPKGCVLTHANCVATIDLYERRLRLEPSSVVFMFLPLAHVLARVTQWVALDVGGTVAFWSGDPARLLDDLAAAQPTHVPSVPRVFEKVHTRALAAAEEAGALKRRLFGWALGVGAAFRAAERADGAGAFLRARHAVADRLVLSKLRGLFGERLELGLSGAAPVSREILEFFDACGVLVLEGYGMTETCAASTLNTVEAFRFGSVGRPLPETRVEIAEDGEVLLSGPSVFAGYHGDERATRETFTPEGWLRSGDLGHLDEDGFLFITGRKKDLIITSSGKNITPTNLEMALRESRWISQAVVYGDRRPYLVALLTLDADEASGLAAELGIEPDVEAMARDPRVHAALQADVDAVNERVARIEQIKRFGILEHDLTQAAGELTPTMKIKRAAVYDRHRETFEALYG